MKSESCTRTVLISTSEVRTSTKSVSCTRTVLISTSEVRTHTFIAIADVTLRRVPPYVTTRPDDVKVNPGADVTVRRVSPHCTIRSDDVDVTVGVAAYDMPRFVT